MQMKLPRGRGRPRGKYRSSADSRLLESLVPISMKYGIDPEKFFDSFVEAWKSQQSTCESLLIECRKKTRDDAVFLITDRFNVVAQFPIPIHILQENNLLKEFAYAKAYPKKRGERIDLKHLQIRDLKSGMKRINLRAKVIEILEPLSVITKFGNVATVTNASITDETGTIKLPLWNEQIDTVSVGDIIRVENARVVFFRGERQLRIGRGGQLSVVMGSEGEVDA